MKTERKWNVNKSGQHIFFLAKFFEKERYANDFVNGRLYANRLSFFKRIEDDGDAYRRDEHEGTIVWGQPGLAQIEINGLNLSHDLAGPVSLSSDRMDHFNVICLYSGKISNYSQGSKPKISEIRNQLIISTECEQFGQYAVLITDGPEFLNRVKKAAKLKNYREAHGLVEYYNPDTFHGNFPGISGAFMKQDKYRYQREYRFVFETGSSGISPIVLDVGDLSDITMRSNIRDINQNLQVHV